MTAIPHRHRAQALKLLSLFTFFVLSVCKFLLHMIFVQSHSTCILLFNRPLRVMLDYINILTSITRLQIKVFSKLRMPVYFGIKKVT